MSFGLLVEGFVPKTLTDIVSSLGGKIRAKLGNEMDLTHRSVWGIIVGVFSSELAEPWLAAEEVYSSGDPDLAGGAALVGMAALTGTVQEGARNSVVPVVLAGTSGTAIPAGRVLSVVNRSDARFLTSEAVTLALVADHAFSTAYVTGSRAKRGGNVYQATTGGTSAGSGGPSGTGTAIVDGSVVWRYLGAGNGAADVDALSERFDAVSAPAFTLTEIVTPVFGLDAVVNLEDAELGQPDESEASLRVRREDELHTSGKAAHEAIRADVLEVDGVKAARVFSNRSDTTNGDGVPPHAVEVVVQLEEDVADGIEDRMFSALLGTVGDGIQTYGTTTVSGLDSEGLVQEFSYSEAGELLVYVRLDLEVTADYPADGDAQVKQAVASYWQAQKTMGYDVSASRLAREAFNVAGVFQSVGLVGTTPSPSSARVVVNPRQVADVDTSRIAVFTSLVTT